MSRDFPGTSGNYLNIGDVAAIDITGTALTLSAWIRPDVVAADQFILSKNNTSSALQYLLRTTSSSKLRLLIGNGGSSFDLVDSLTSLTTSTWQHVTGRKNGTGSGAIRVYINGSDDNNATSNLSIGNTAEPLRMGAQSSDGSLRFDGMIAEVAIWNIALSSTEISDLANGMSPLSIQPANLKGYWPLYGLASPETDLSGSGNGATIVGTVPAGSQHIPKEIYLHSASSPQSMDEQPEYSTNSAISTQSLEEAIAITSENSADSSQTISQALGDVSVSVQTSTQDFGRSQIPLLDLDFLGVDSVGHAVSDSEGKHYLENLSQRTVLEIVSIDSSSQTVTFITPYEIDGLELEDREVTIPAGETRYIGVFPANIYNTEVRKVLFDPSVSGTLKFRSFLVL